MAHTYVVTENTALGDTATLVGTVDGIAVTITYNLSAIAGLTLAQAKNFIAPIMLNAAIPPAPATVSQLPTGTFTQ